MSGNWYRGNAEEDGLEYRGWLLGHFIDPAEGVRHSTDVKVKWGIHPAGETPLAVVAPVSPCRPARYW